MFSTFVKAAAFFTLVFVARAGGGNTSYRAEVEPLVRSRPDLALKLSGLTIADTGDGTRVSYLQSPGLAGKHVGPYEFSAVDAVGKKVIVRFRTRQRFVNAHGVVVAEFFDGDLVAGGSTGHAARVEEELVGVTVL